MYFHLEHTGVTFQILAFFYFFLPVTSLLVPYANTHCSWPYPVSAFISFLSPLLTARLYLPLPLFFIPPLLVFFPGLISLLSPLDHGPPHTAIMQLDREIVWLLKCVCVRKCETLCSQNRQSGPLSYTAHALMCKPLVNSAAARGHSRCNKGDMVVCVCSVGWEGGVQA